MATRSKSFSHSTIIKVIVFIIAIACFTAAITIFLNMLYKDDIQNIGVALEESYIQSEEFGQEVQSLINDMIYGMSEYKSEEYILSGKSINEHQLEEEKQYLFAEFTNTATYNPNLSEQENYQTFEKAYADKIKQAKEKLIQEDLREFSRLMQRLESKDGYQYYISNGDNTTTFKNTEDSVKEDFTSNPAYFVFNKEEETIFPAEFEENPYYKWIHSLNYYELSSNTTLYLAFSDRYMEQQAAEWKQDKSTVTDYLYQIGAILAGLLVSLSYLIVVAGRTSFKDKEVHLHKLDRLYNDLKIILCGLLIFFWAVLIMEEPHAVIGIPLTFIMGAFGLLLVLSLIKHLKNRTFLSHTLIYLLVSKGFTFIKDVYNSGNTAVKVVLLVIGYPVLVVITFFMFPVTLGLAAWLAFKKVKELNAIKAGVERVRDGDIHHSIEVEGKGEFAQLAANINTITDGLNKAIDRELRSERLKTELITNVSHDIRTPLTAIITYVDLLKKEENEAQAAEYIDIIEQKAERLKVLTDDLFEASKASSGNIPVKLEKIDMVSLITQGLGELNDKVEESDLEFKINYPSEKLYVQADGKLLWRSVENLLSNIFKYALKGSRVYIDVQDTNSEAVFTIKNISAYELNISSDELLERFKRGDESRSSEGSGLGLSIAKSLIDAQNGRFQIEIDGDLFKVQIHMPKYKEM